MKEKPPLIEYVEDIYNDKYVEDHETESLNDSSALKNIELGPNLQKLRVESFAKTPYFLKSPRSVTSNRY